MSNDNVKKDIETLLLDSSLISKYKMSKLCQNRLEKYSVKIINCNDYIQVYYYENATTKYSDSFNDSKNFDNLDREIRINKLLDFDTENLSKTKFKNELRTISYLNASRSRFNCQRLAKSNISEWGTFITLTFADNDTLDIEDIPTCNKVFNSWVSNIRKLKKDFKYLAVPEIQKSRGRRYGVYAIHYHVLSNISIEDVPDVIFPQKEFTEEQLKTMTDLERSKCYDVRYWNKGYTRVDFIKGDIRKIIGYISKYMTKDIDNKFFGKRRYFYSHNLNKPFVDYLDLSCDRDKLYFSELLKSYDVDFFNTYNDKLDNHIEYFEFRKHRT